MELMAALQVWFSDGGNDAIESFEVIEGGNYRVSFVDGSVSDWRIVLDPDTGEVLDGYCFNDVI
jgi:hypothetical protein